MCYVLKLIDRISHFNKNKIIFNDIYLEDRNGFIFFFFFKIKKLISVILPVKRLKCLIKGISNLSDYENLSLFFDILKYNHIVFKNYCLQKYDFSYFNRM